MESKDTKTLQSIFEQASKLVADLPENIQNTAFEIAVSKLSGDANIYQDGIEGSQVSSGAVYQKSSPSFFTNLKNATGLSIDQLKGVYEFENGKIKVVLPLPNGKKIAEQQRLLAHLFLFANQVGKKESDWTRTVELTEVIKDHGVFNKHLAKNLGVDRSKLKLKGTKTGRFYGLTPTGINSVKIELKKIIGDENGGQ